MNLVLPTRPKRTPLFAFFAANLISYVGSYLTGLAIPWFVLETTGSVEKTGITAFFTALPTILSAFLSGPVIDRLGYKRTSVIADIASGLGMMLIPLLFRTTGLAFWQLLILTFLSGLLKGPGETAHSSLLPDLGKEARMPLERVNAIGDGMSRVSGLFGAPLAGLLIVLIGASNLLWLDTASFFVSALLIGLVVPAAIGAGSAKAKEEKEAATTPNGLLDGLRFILHNRLLLATITTVMITNLLDAAMFGVAEPAYARQIWGSALPLGVLIAIFGGSAFLGTVLFGIFGHRLPRRMTYSLCSIGIGMYYWALAFRLPFPLLLVVFAVNGLLAGPLNPILSTVQQEAVPPALRARVFGAASAGFMAGVPLGGLLGGLLIGWIGLIPALLVMGSCYLLTMGSLLINPALRDMEKPVSVAGRTEHAKC